MLTKLYHNQDQDQAEVKNYFTMDFFLKLTIIYKRLTVGML